jgi:DNA-binding transcriptional MerR regulator
MAYKKPVIKKVYYRIGEVAEMFGVNISLIRFWENEFDIIKPYRNKKGNRFFTQADVDNFHIIYNLVKEQGYTLNGAKDKLKGNFSAVAEKHEVIKTLQEIKAFLQTLKEDL